MATKHELLAAARKRSVEAGTAPQGVGEWSPAAVPDQQGPVWPPFIPPKDEAGREKAFAAYEMVRKKAIAKFEAEREKELAEFESARVLRMRASGRNPAPKMNRRVVNIDGLATATNKQKSNNSAMAEFAKWYYNPPGWRGTIADQVTAKLRDREDRFPDVNMAPAALFAEVVDAGAYEVVDEEQPYRDLALAYHIVNSLECAMGQVGRNRSAEEYQVAKVEGLEKLNSAAEPGEILVWIVAVGRGAATLRDKLDAVAKAISADGKQKRAVKTAITEKVQEILSEWEKANPRLEAYDFMKRVRTHLAVYICSTLKDDERSSFLALPSQVPSGKNGSADTTDGDFRIFLKDVSSLESEIATNKNKLLPRMCEFHKSLSTKFGSLAKVGKNKDFLTWFQQNFKRHVRVTSKSV